MKLHKNLSYATYARSKPDTLCFLCLFSACCPKCDISCVGLVHCWRWNLDLMKWAEFWSCWLNHEKRLKSWNKLKSWNPENLRGNLYPNHEIRLKSWNKIEILKQDWFRKNKNSYICVVLSRRFAPWPGPLFFALKIVITTDLATCLRVRHWLLLLLILSKILLDTTEMLSESCK